MSMKLFIFRHGQTDANFNNIIQGALIDYPLNAEGRLQAEELRDVLTEKKIGVIYSSYMIRAHETAQIVSGGKVEVMTLEGLEEVSYGEAEGMPSADAHFKYKDIFDIIHNEEHPLHNDICIPGGETVRQSTERALEALEYIRRHTDAENVGVASHGSLMYNIHKHFYGAGRKFANCEYFVLEL